MRASYLHTPFIVVLSLISIFDAKSQNNLSQSLASIKEKVQDVQIDKTTFKQSIDVLDENKGKLSFVSEQVDEKGKSARERFEFYMSDIDKNTIIRKTSGKKLLISLSVNNNQKFIKHFKEDKPDSYTSSLEILFAAADAAQELADLFKNTIPMVKSGENNWNANTEALSWLKKTISKITSGSATFEQSFSYGEPRDYLASFSLKKSDQKNAQADEKYEFSILDLNEKKLGIKISGTQLSVSVETNGNEPYIKYAKNNEQQNYVNDFEIIAEDIDQAHNIISALSVAIEKSKRELPDFGSLQKSLDFITKNTTAVTLDKKMLDQKISFIPGNGTKAIFTYTEPDSKGKIIEERFEFYLSDMDANSLNFKVSGKKIAVIPISKNKTKLIRYYKDNAPQDFQNEVDIITSDIESTREMIEAFKAAIKSSEPQPFAWKNISEALKYLTDAMTGETIGADKFKLNFSTLSTEPLNVRYLAAKTDAKGITMEQSYEFYPYMLDPNSVKITSSGKYLNVEASVNGKKSFIKEFKDGRQQSYDDVIEIIAFDSRQAAEIAGAIKYLATSSKPKDMVWNDKQSAMKFITGNVGDVKSEGKEVKQKLELINNDPCRISLKVSSTDEKGKTTDEIFEFSLPDMNKQMVDLKVSGKSVIMNIPSKNKTKLVKAYKNGEQQAWRADAEIEATDIETARNVVEAFKSAITHCEK